MGEAERAATQRSLVLKGCSLQSQGPSEPCGEYPCVSMCVCVCVEAALGVRLPGVLCMKLGVCGYQCIMYSWIYQQCCPDMCVELGSSDV